VSKILSQDEIDLLLESRTDKVEEPQPPHVDPAASSGGVLVYNFRRPDRIAKEQLRSLHFLHDRFALNISTSLSAFLRSMTEVSIVSVEQFAYSEFLMSLPDPTAFYALSLQPLDMIGALELNPTVAFTMVDRMLGGTGDSESPNRPLTEIEQNVVDTVVNLLLDSLTEKWRAVTNVQFKIHGRETRPQMLQVMGPNETVILIVFDVRVGDSRGMLNLCIPAAAIEAVGETFAQGWNRPRRQPTAEETAHLTSNLGRVPLNITAEIGTTLAARDLVALQRGDVLSLGRSSSQPINVHVAGLPTFVGRLTQQNGSLAISVQPITVDTPEGTIA
jgi:flagellar motor switch protein FliM